MKKYIFNIVIVVGLIISVFLGAKLIGYCIEQARIAAETQAKIKTAKSEIRVLIQRRHEDDFVDIKVVDPWGHNYFISIKESEEGTTKTYYVVSPGPDSIFLTRDDISEINTDLNWTKTGQAAGIRVGRVSRGILSGLLKSGDGK